MFVLLSVRFVSLSYELYEYDDYGLWVPFPLSDDDLGFYVSKILLCEISWLMIILRQFLGCLLLLGA